MESQSPRKKPVLIDKKKAGDCTPNRPLFVPPSVPNTPGLSRGRSLKFVCVCAFFFLDSIASTLGKRFNRTLVRTEVWTQALRTAEISRKSCTLFSVRKKLCLVCAKPWFKRISDTLRKGSMRRDRTPLPRSSMA